jgi:transposase
VVLEATYGWYWAVDVLEACGTTVHLAHPLGVKGFSYRRVKNDVRDATDLADLWRMGRLPEAWIAPPRTRELRELVRYRAKLVALRSGLKAQVHAVLAKEGVRVDVADLFGKTGLALLRETPLATCCRMRVDSLVELIDAFDGEVAWLTAAIAARLRHHPGYTAIQQIPGVGPTLAAVFVVEIGDIDRFCRAPQLDSWAGLTPKHHESDTTVVRGRITKQGSRLVRWAAVEGRPTTAARSEAAARPRPHRRPTGPPDRGRRGRPPAAHAGVLRAARRPHPLPAARPRRGGVNRRDRGSASNRRRALAVCHDSRRLPAWSPV